jgi:hypothetical protein
VSVISCASFQTTTTKDTYYLLKQNFSIVSSAALDYAELTTTSYEQKSAIARTILKGINTIEKADSGVISLDVAIQSIRSTIQILGSLQTKGYTTL